MSNHHLIFYPYIGNVKIYCGIQAGHRIGQDKNSVGDEGSKVQEVKEECKKWAEVAANAKEGTKALQNYIEELKTDVIEKDTRLDCLQKRNYELNAIFKKAKGDAVAEFKASKQFPDMLDRNYAAGFEDFRMDVIEKFPEIDFNSIKLNLSGAAMSSLLQTSSEDINVEDDASTQPPKDTFNTDAPPA